MNPLVYLALGVQIGVLLGVAIMCLLIVSKEKRHDRH